MSLPDIFVRLSQLGYSPTMEGKPSNKYSVIYLGDYIIQNRVVDKGFRITSENTFLSLPKGKDVVKFFETKEEREL